VTTTKKSEDNAQNHEKSEDDSRYETLRAQYDRLCEDWRHFWVA